MVAPRVGGQVTLFAVVIADPCPSIQWMVNGSAIGHSDAGYTISNPCGSLRSYLLLLSNFTLTITATTATTGTYNAILTNSAGTKEVPDVFVTPPGILTLEMIQLVSYRCDNILFSAVPVVVTQLQISSVPHCLLNGTSVNIKCVNSGFPRPEIVFFRGTEQITPGNGNFSNFERLERKFDTIRLKTARKEDVGDYICVARTGTSAQTSCGIIQMCAR